MALKVYKTYSDGVEFRDPAHENLSVRFKTREAAKSLDGNRFNNRVTEIIFNDLVDVGMGETIYDPVSVRLRLSGTPEALARQEAFVNSITSGMAQWIIEDVTGGFPPATAPVIV